MTTFPFSGKSIIAWGTALFILIFSNLTLAATAPSISLKSITTDIEFLASDALKGRFAGSPEIKIAANYIANRFSDIGLTPLSGDNFLQPFSSYRFEVQTLEVSLNNKAIDPKRLALVSNQQTINWQNLNDIKLTKVSAKKDLYNVLHSLNQQGGQHLVLVNKKHRALFNRFQKHFSSPKTKLDITTPSSLLLVLSNTTEIKSIDAKATLARHQQTLNNVVGVLPGKSKKDDYVIFSAHYDHIGVAETYTTRNDTDSIFNGADDDASGTTAVIQLANYFKKLNNNERTIVFVAFTAEEIGGLGSAHFAQFFTPNAIKAMVNIEMIGKPSKFGEGTVWMTGYQRSNLASLMNNSLLQSTKENQPMLKIFEDPYPEQKLFYRSDNATLARLGVPAHSFSSTQLDKDPHYHQVTDEVNTLDLSSMKKVIETLALASEAIVNGSATPSRVDTTQVKSKGKIF